MFLTQKQRERRSEKKKTFCQTLPPAVKNTLIHWAIGWSSFYSLSYSSHSFKWQDRDCDSRGRDSLQCLTLQLIEGASLFTAARGQHFPWMRNQIQNKSETPNPASKQSLDDTSRFAHKTCSGFRECLIFHSLRTIYQNIFKNSMHDLDLGGNLSDTLVLSLHQKSWDIALKMSLKGFLSW